MYVQNQASTVPLDSGYLRVGYKLELYELRKYSGFDRKGRVGADALIEAHQRELHGPDTFVLLAGSHSSPLFFVFLVRKICSMVIYSTAPNTSIRTQQRQRFTWLLRCSPPRASYGQRKTFAANAAAPVSESCDMSPPQLS